jgi:hypothetical protein
MKTSSIATAVLGTLVAGTVLAQPPKAGEPISFVACPIMQDNDTVPCWVADHAGERYFLGIQTDASGWAAPHLKHKVLVEGRVAADMPRICGGIVLESSGNPFERGSSGSINGKPLPNPPVTSTMRELDPGCNTILPARAEYNTFEPRRGPGPNVRRLPPTPEEAAAARARQEAQRQASIPVPPFEARTFEVHYEFDSEYSYLHIGNARQALDYARAVNAKRIKITAHRSSSLLSDGSRIEELPYMARKRAEDVAEVMGKLGLPDGIALEVTWDDTAIQGDGIDDWEGRVTRIEVFPG